jgi:hypothetical protein
VDSYREEALVGEVIVAQGPHPVHERRARLKGEAAASPALVDVSLEHQSPCVADQLEAHRRARRQGRLVRQTAERGEWQVERGGGVTARCRGTAQRELDQLDAPLELDRPCARDRRRRLAGSCRSGARQVRCWRVLARRCFRL